MEKKNDNATKVRLSTSRKNKMTDQYETDFSGFVDFVGKDAAPRAMQLKEKDRIQLGEVAVTNRYDKEKGVTYTNFNCFSFDTGESGSRMEPSAYEGGSGEPEPRNKRLPY